MRDQENDNKKRVTRRSATGWGTRADAAKKRDDADVEENISKKERAASGKINSKKAAPDRGEARERAPRKESDRESVREAAPKQSAPTAVRRGGDPDRTVHQLVPYALICLAPFAAVSFLLRDVYGLEGSTGAFGNFLADFLCGLLGIAGYLLPLFMLVLGIRWRRFVRDGLLVRKLFLSASFLLLLAGIIHVFQDTGARAVVHTAGRALYDNGVIRAGGGFFGGFVGEWMGYIFRLLGTCLLAIPLLLIIGIYLVGLTPVGLYERISYKVRILLQKRQERRERREQSAVQGRTPEGTAPAARRQRAPQKEQQSPSEPVWRRPRAPEHVERANASSYFTFSEEEDEPLRPGAHRELVDIPDDEAQTPPVTAPVSEPERNLDGQLVDAPFSVQYYQENYVAAEPEAAAERAPSRVTETGFAATAQPAEPKKHIPSRVTDPGFGAERLRQAARSNPVAAGVSRVTEPGFGAERVESVTAKNQAPGVSRVTYAGLGSVPTTPKAQKASEPPASHVTEPSLGLAYGDRYSEIAEHHASIYGEGVAKIASPEALKGTPVAPFGTAPETLDEDPLLEREPVVAAGMPFTPVSPFSTVELPMDEPTPGTPAPAFAARDTAPLFTPATKEDERPFDTDAELAYSPAKEDQPDDRAVLIDDAAYDDMNAAYDDADEAYDDADAAYDDADEAYDDADEAYDDAVESPEAQQEITPVVERVEPVAAPAVNAASFTVPVREEHVRESTPVAVQAQRVEPAPPPEPEPPRPYVYPPVDLLNEDMNRKNADHSEEIREKTEILRKTLSDFRINIKEQVDCSRGPTITRYEVRLEGGVSMRQIQNRIDDISLYMSAPVRIAAVPGKPAVGIEVPNTVRDTVYMRTMLESEAFRSSNKPMEVPLGLDIGGNVQLCDLAAMPHLLVAGTTGSGKSVCINSMLLSLIYKTSPEDLRLILIDPKQIEFAPYEHVPHLYMPIVTDMQRAAGALACAVQEMERRFSLIKDVGVRDIESYNRAVRNDPEREHLPRIVIVIDEFADLKMSCANNDPENFTCRLAQKARAAGIHLIIGTQRPSVDVITGKLKTNIASRIAFMVKQQVDSRTILDMNGAEMLAGRGDMLFAPANTSDKQPRRIQGAFVTDGELERVINYVRRHNDPVRYNQAFMDQIEAEMARAANAGKKDDFDDLDEDEGGEDPKFREAVELAVQTQKVATSLLQRRLGVGYGRAAKIIDRMEELGLVTPAEGNKPRKLLPTAQGYLDHMDSLEADEYADEYDE